MLISTRTRSAWYALAVTLMVLLAGACEEDSFKPQAVPEPGGLFWDLMLSEHAVTMALTPPYDTLTVVATPRNYQGEPLAGLPQPQYRSLNPSLVGVTPDGVLTAVAAPQTPDTFATVIASLTVGNLVHADTLTVRVVNDPTPQAHILETLSIHPVPPDSAKWASDPDDVFTRRMLSALVRATYVGGASVPTTPVETGDAFGTQVDIADVHLSIRSSDTTRAVIYQVSSFAPSSSGLRGIQLHGIRPGDIQLYVSATVFGVKKVDTLPFRVGFPVNQTVRRNTAEGIFFDKPSIVLGTGGVVWWISAGPVDVTFADPTNVAALSTAAVEPWASTMFRWCLILSFQGGDCNAAGSFTLPGPGAGFTMRVFHVPGIYDYHDAEGRTGRITVSGD